MTESKLRETLQSMLDRHPTDAEKCAAFDKLRKTAECEPREILSGEHHEDSDNKVYIFEATMEAMFGKDYFEITNPLIG